jgi:predicted phage-related endonuclease
MNKAEICNRYISIKMEMKNLQDELKELETNLKSDLSEDLRKKGSALAVYGDYTVTLSEQVRILADSAALKEAGIFEKYSKPSVAEFLKVIKK